MAYSKKVLDHYENPRNVGTLDIKAINVGTGMVGAPACGDVMRLQIQVDDEDIITDAKFKTYGCFTSNMEINTPTHATKISELRIGDKVLAWNGEKIVNQKIKEIHKSFVEVDDILRVTFQRESGKTFSLLCTKNHIFWNSNNTPIEAQDLAIGQELYEITEHELRKLTNIRHRSQFRKKLSKRMKDFNKSFDHSTLPQNKAGYKCKDIEKKRMKSSSASKEMWKNPVYRENWAKGMSKINWKQPTSIEQKFIKLFEENNVAVKWCAGEKWIQTSLGPASPDFIVPGKKKCIEVYTEKLPKHMQDRSKNSDYIKNRKEQLASAGYESLFLSIENINESLSEVQNFIHNGIKIIDISEITHSNQLRGCERNENKQIAVYDLELENGAHVYFSKRVGSHNCGSAIASSSLLTEWVKGKSLDEAQDIKNTEIAEELALPPVKIHCSVLAEDAIKAAIKDLKEKKDETN